MSKNVASNSLNINKLKSDDFLAGLHTSYLSNIEASILRANFLIKTEEPEEFDVFGDELSIYNRKLKVEIPLSKYSLNEDKKPKIIKKKLENKLVYIQELVIRYLRPPTIDPSEIVIKQEPDYYLTSAPPLVIRQQPKQPKTPEPLVIREDPPKQPPLIGRKIPPPPRKVVIERLPPLPAKPQSIVVERWLPFKQIKRKVIFKGVPPDPILVKPRNVIVQWMSPSCIVKKQIKHLGIVRANPTEYVDRYGSSLKCAKDLPQFILDIPLPPGLELADDIKSDKKNHNLIGEEEALRSIDLENLEREGLDVYKSFLNENNKIKKKQKNDLKMPLIEKIFHQIDLEGIGSLTYDEAEQIFQKIKPRLNKKIRNGDFKKFLKNLDKNNLGFIRIKDFRNSFKFLL